jgi:mono/diheme cytochrome c family protein
MNLIKLFLTLSAIIFFAIACGNNNEQTVNKTVNNSANVANTVNTQTTISMDEFATAKKQYKEMCVKCHKEDGSGGQIEGDLGKFNVTSFKSEKSMKHDEAKMIAYITNGDDEMPAFKGKLSDQEIKDITKFIRKDFQGR